MEGKSNSMQAAETRSVLNSKYKDSVFLVFSEKEKLLELANALFDASYTLDTPLDINTIEEALYGTTKNDLSFIVDGTYVILSEHQSTINMNMPLRHLLYFDELMKDYIKEQNDVHDVDLYQRTAIKLPRPKFIVLYNGNEPIDSETTLQLENSFLGEGETSLNLTVKVYNVNKGSGCSLLEKCPTLYQYGQLVEMVRSYLKAGPVGNHQMQEIIDRCKKEGILVDFMEKYGHKGIDLLRCELTDAEIRERERKYAREEGLERGIAEGMDRINRLNKLLAKEGRIDELVKSAADRELQNALLKEFGI